MNKTEKIHEPLFHISRRKTIETWKAVLIRAITIIAALIVCAVLIVILTGENPLKIYKSMFLGAFGTKRRIWNLLQSIAILLCISLAITPAFRMKFWNCGAEGQVLIGGLASVVCMIYVGDALPTWLLFIVMTLASIAGGIVWTLIPAIFKARFNTNETLFTLMMNYIAIQLVSFCIKTWSLDSSIVKTLGSGILPAMPQYGFPALFGQKSLINVIVVAVITVIMYIYLKYSKHGYEIAVAGESEKTARYIGINVKKVIVRTMILSGALCGIAGVLLVAGTDHTISTETVGGRGFTAIMVSWLGKFNPIFMVLTTFLICFLEKGASQISTDFRLDTSLSDIMTGVILFFIIGCEFFINYKINFRKSEKEAK